MALTNLQMGTLAASSTFQLRVQSSIYKKSLSIVEDVAVNGTVANPKPTKTGNYTEAQLFLARTIINGQTLMHYYVLVACSTNVIAGGVLNAGTDTDITDASLDSQVFTTIFVDTV